MVDTAADVEEVMADVVDQADQEEAMVDVVDVVDQALDLDPVYLAESSRGRCL